MWAVDDPDAWLAALRRRQTVFSYAEVITDGQAIEPLPVVDGYVEVDRGAPSRRRATFRIADDAGELTPRTAADLLHPASGHEIQVYRGLVLSDGTRMEAPVGRFGIEDHEIDDSREGLSIEVVGWDRMKAMSRGTLQGPATIPSGTPGHEAIEQLLTGRIIGQEFRFTETNLTTPRLQFDVGDDPAAKALELAASFGMELFMDPVGVCVLQPQPDPSSDEVVDTYREGDGGKLLHVNRRLTRERTFNRVIVIGEHSELAGPVRGEAFDDEPDSPTYVDGPFGDVPETIRTRYLRDASQAQIAAEARYRLVKGLIERARFVGVVNAAHEVGDVIRLERARAALDAAFLLERFTLPLAASQPMQADVRERRVAA